MKHFLFSILIITGFYSCMSKSITNRTDFDKYKQIKSAFNIHQELYLENRVENCDSAIVFMKQVIEPIGISPLPNDIRIVIVKIRIPGESKSFILKSQRHNGRITTNNIKFYLSDSCLVGIPLSTVLDIFCTKDDKNKLLKFNNVVVHSNADNVWNIEIYPLGFGLNLVIENGVVKNAYFPYGEYEN